MMSLGFMFIIGRNITDDLPGWFPLCTSCIILDQAGLGDPNSTELFQRMSRLTVGTLLLKLCSFS